MNTHESSRRDYLQLIIQHYVDFGFRIFFGSCILVLVIFFNDLATTL